MRQWSLWMLMVSLLAVVPSCAPRETKVPGVPSGTPLSGSESKATVPDDVFQVKLETTKGDVVIELHPAWAPLGVKRFRELVELGFYNDAAFFRVVPGFVVQFGMNGDPTIHNRWAENNIDDEPVRESNKRGYVTFAKQSLPNTRSTQLFINFGDNPGLDADGFSPIGKVVEGMDVVDKINAEYGQQPVQPQIAAEGNAYLKSQFPRLDYIKSASVVDDKASATNEVPGAADEKP